MPSGNPYTQAHRTASGQPFPFALMARTGFKRKRRTHNMEANGLI